MPYAHTVYRYGRMPVLEVPGTRYAVPYDTAVRGYAGTAGTVRDPGKQLVGSGIAVYTNHYR